MVFFPCIYFCENNQLYFTGKHRNLNKIAIKERADIIIKRGNAREYLYGLCLKLFTICDLRGLKMIVENPYATQHFLVNNFPYQAKIIDKDRTKRGDYYKKPTQYFFINIEPTFGNSLQKAREHKRISYSASGVKAGICSEERSIISPDYARNFICDFILGKEQDNTIPTLF